MNPPSWHDDPPRDPECLNHGTEYELDPANPCPICLVEVALAHTWRGWTEWTGCVGMDCAHCDVCNLCAGSGLVCQDCWRCPEHPHPQSGDPEPLPRSDHQVERLLAFLPVRAASEGGEPEDQRATDATYVNLMARPPLSCYDYDGSPGCFDRPPVHTPVYFDRDARRWAEQ